MTRSGAPSPKPPGALVFLRVRAVWLSPLIIGGIMVALMALTYVGALKDPIANLRALPIAVVNQDVGSSTTDGSTDFGRQLTRAITGSKAVSEHLSIDVIDRRTAESRLDRGEDYAVVLIPKGFTESLLALSRPSAADGTSGSTTVQLIANPRLGSAGVGLATGILSPVLSAASERIGSDLLALAPSTAAFSAAAAKTLHDPVDLATVPYRPLPGNSALGLSPFYLALLAIMCGFLGATLINSTVDAALGYSTTETGSRWHQRVPVPITRWQTLLTKWALAVVIPSILVAIVLFVAVVILGLNAPGAGYLWAFMSLVAITVAAGTLALFAALGSLGQLVALILFVYLALASSGATVPVQALPQPFATISHVDPLRRAFAGVRSVIFFNGQAADGWQQATVVLLGELVFWVLLGAAAALWYDRRGLTRLAPELIAYVTRSAASYPGAPAPPQATVDGESDSAVSGETQPRS